MKGQGGCAQVKYPMTLRQGLVTSLYLNSNTGGAALASTTATSWKSEDFTGTSDNRPVLNQACRKRNAIIDQECFTHAWHSFMEPRPLSWKRTCRRTLSLCSPKLPMP